MQQSSESTLTALEKEEMYRQIVEYSFEPTIIHSKQLILHINQAAADFFKIDKATAVGTNLVDMFTEDYRELITERIRKGTEEKIVSELMETAVRRFEGTITEVDIYCHPVPFGEAEAIQSILRDITARKKAERKVLQLKNEIATPVVPVIEGIAVLPLVGSVDSDRTSKLLEIIPQKIQGQQLQCLIIDVSGIYNIDRDVVEFLYSIDSIMQLLGIQLIFTGIRPDLALKVVELQVNFGQLTTMATVKQALKSLMVE